MRGRLTSAVAVAVALAGCGSGGGGGEDVSPIPPKTFGAGEQVVVKAREFRFNPESLLVEEQGGGPASVTIELRNEGNQAHDLRLRRAGDDVGGTPIFGPKQTRTAKVSLDPGSYEVFCSVGDHEALGMKGTLVIQ